MTNIFIANLDWEITSEDLKATFSAFGPVTYAHVVYEKDTKRSKGYGYVEMEETDHAINAIQALNGMEINGRKLDVKIASPKGNRPEKKPPVEKKPFEKKPFNKQGGGRFDQKKPFHKKPDGGHRPYGDKPQGSRPYGDKPQGDKPYGDRPYRERPQGDRPGYNQDRPFKKNDDNKE